MNANLKYIIENMLEIIIGCVFLVAITFLFMAVWNVATSDGKGDFCYIEPYTYNDGAASQMFKNSYILKMHRSWRTDRLVDYRASSFEEAVEQAKLINCELR